MKKRYSNWNRGYENDLARLWEDIPLIDSGETYTGIILDGFWLGTNTGYAVIFYDIKHRVLRRYEDYSIVPTIMVEGQVDADQIGSEVSQAFHALKEQMITISKIRTEQSNYRWNKQINPRQNRVIGASVDFDGKYFLEKQLNPGITITIRKGRIFIPISKTEEEDVRSKLLGEPEPIIELAEMYMPFFDQEIPHIRRAAFDIEVLVPRGIFPLPEKAEYPVHSVGVYDCSGNSWVYIMGYYPTRSELELIKEELGYLPQIRTFIDEGELLSQLFSHLEEYPILLSYNGDNFDFPYLLNRARNLDVDCHIQRGKSRGRNVDYHFRGSIHLDLFRFFVNNAVRLYAFGAKYSRVRLDDVAEALLGVKKVEHDLWFDEMSRDQMVAYTIRDVELTQKLTEFSDELTMKLLVMFMRVGKMTITSVNRDSISRWILNWIAYEHYRKNWVLPSKTELKERGAFESDADIEGKQYKGAIVFDPDSGVYWDVTVADYASLYPSVIKKFRLSYETLRCHHENCRSNTVPELSHWVCRQQPGIMAMLVGFVRDVRVNWYKGLAKTATTEVRRAQAKTIEQALKVFINASYGVFGNRSFSLFCPPVAESTTAYARYALEEAKKMAEQQEFAVLYGDTDSIFIHKVTERRLFFIPQVIHNKLMRMSKWVDEHLQSIEETDHERLVSAYQAAKNWYISLKEFLELHCPFLFRISYTRFRKIQYWSQITLGIPLGIDYKFRFLVLSGRKKNYFGVTEDGDMIIKGLQVKKSNTAIFIREIFEEVKQIMVQVKTRRQLERAKETMLELLRDARAELKQGKVELEKLAKMVTLRKNFSDYQTSTPAVQAALQEMTEHNEQEYEVGAQFMVVSVHARPFVVYTNRFDHFPYGTRMAAKFMQVRDIRDTMQVDWGKYEEQLKNAFTPIFESFDMEWEDELDHQTGIDQFFADRGKKIKSIKVKTEEKKTEILRDTVHS